MLLGEDTAAPIFGSDGDFIKKINKIPRADGGACYQ